MVVIIRKYQPQDRKAVINICWKTGYMGEEAEGHFDDPYLFGLLFCVYYLDYEPENCFVAEDENNGKIVGYILSSFDSKKQEEHYRKRMIPKILRRAFLYTIWRHPKTLRTLWHFKNSEESLSPLPNEKEFNSSYPAHLHIDILKEYQRQGIGTQLIQTLESHLHSHNIKGVHIGTGDKNFKAVPFYYKMGYSLIYESPPGNGMWPDAKEVKSLIFTKKIH